MKTFVNGLAVAGLLLAGAVTMPAPAGAHTENGGSNENLWFVTDVPGADCDGWRFLSHRPDVVSGQLVGEFTAGASLVEDCTYELSVVEYLTGSIAYLDDTARIIVAHPPSSNEPSNTTTSCTGSNPNHQKFASAIYIEGGQFSTANDDTGDGFDAWGGGWIRNHMVCPYV